MDEITSEQACALRQQPPGVFEQAVLNSLPHADVDLAALAQAQGDVDDERLVDQLRAVQHASVRSRARTWAADSTAVRAQQSEPVRQALAGLPLLIPGRASGAAERAWAGELAVFARTLPSEPELAEALGREIGTYGVQVAALVEVYQLLTIRVLAAGCGRSCVGRTGRVRHNNGGQATAAAARLLCAMPLQLAELVLARVAVPVEHLPALPYALWPVLEPAQRERLLPDRLRVAADLVAREMWEPTIGQVCEQATLLGKRIAPLRLRAALEVAANAASFDTTAQVLAALDELPDAAVRRLLVACDRAPARTRTFAQLLADARRLRD